MHFSRLILRILFSFFLLITLVGSSWAGQSVQFSWAILKDTATGLQPLDFSTIPQLKSGTMLQIYIEQKPGAYIYIYLIDPSGSLTFIYPGDPKYYDAMSPTDKIVRIPPDAARFELMPPNGQEKLYLLASPSRLTKLEQLTTAFMKNDADKTRRADVIKELKLLHRQYSSLGQKTETSVPIAGTVRTRGEASSSFNAIQVNAEGFYSRILRINHE